MPLRLCLYTLLIALLAVAVESPHAAERALERFQEFLDNGDPAVRDGRCASAEDWYLDAVREAEAIDAKGPLLVRGLVRLAEVYRRQGSAGRGRVGPVQRRLKALSPASPEAAAAVARSEGEASKLAPKPATPGRADTTETDYLEKIRERIKPKWIYPGEAGERGIEGEGVADFAIRRDGSLHVARITRSTGVPILDKAMLDAIGLAQPFPVVPDAIAQDPYQIDLDFRYQIVGSTSPSPRPVTRPPEPSVVCR